MLKKAYSQANRARANIALGVMDVQHLGFPDNTFNFVISSLVCVLYSTVSCAGVKRNPLYCETEWADHP